MRRKLGPVGVTGNHRFGVYPNFLTQNDVFITSTHTHTHQPFARRYKYRLLSIRYLLGATHQRDQNSGDLQNNLELKSKPDLKFTSSLTVNGKFETAILDETRTSAQGKVKVHLKDMFWIQFAHTPTKRSKISIFNRFTTLTTRNTPHTHTYDLVVYLHRTRMSAIRVLALKAHTECTQVRQ